MGEEKKGFFKRLVSGLTKTRDSIVSSMDNINRDNICRNNHRIQMK